MSHIESPDDKENIVALSNSENSYVQQFKLLLNVNIFTQSASEHYKHKLQQCGDYYILFKKE